MGEYKHEPSQWIQKTSEFYAEKQSRDSFTCIAHSVNAILGRHAVCPNKILKRMQRDPDIGTGAAGLCENTVRHWIQDQYGLTLICLPTRWHEMPPLLRSIRAYTRVLLSIGWGDSIYLHSVALIRRNVRAEWHVVDSLYEKALPIFEYFKMLEKSRCTGVQKRVTMQIRLVAVRGGMIEKKVALETHSMLDVNGVGDNDDDDCVMLECDASPTKKRQRCEQPRRDYASKLMCRVCPSSVDEHHSHLTSKY